MTVDEILKYLNNEIKPPESQRLLLNKWRNLYFGMSLHTSGASPAFVDLSNNGLQVPVTSQGAGYNAGYSNYLSSLQSIGFDYNGYWIFPPNFQGWEYHFIFDKIIFSRHPRESEHTRQWRFSQYVPVTQAPCGLLNEVVTGAIFQDSNYTVSIEDKEDNEYIKSNNFYGFDFIGYISNILYKSIVEDANGYVLRIPKLPWYEQPDNGKIEVEIKFINTKELRYHSPNQLIFIKDGYGWYIDTNIILRFSYNETEKKYVQTAEDAKGYFAHKLGRLPITKAGGVYNTHGYFESYYYKAKPVMDDFIRSYSSRQLIDKEASTPVIVEPNVDCPECHGAGQIRDTCTNCPPEAQNVLVNCSGCNGKGKISRNPGEHLVLDREDFKAGVDIKFINPDVAVNKNMRETCAELFTMIIEALHLNKTEEAQSGVAKALDQERLYKFISGISNDLFDKIIPDCLRDIIEYRNVQAVADTTNPDNKLYTLVKPTQFQIKTSQDLLEEYKTATESNLPVFIRQKIALDYLDKEYSGDEVLKKKGCYIISTNPFAVYSTADKISYKGIATQEQLIYDEMISKWLDDIIEDKGNEWFVDATYEQIETEIELLEDEFYKENPTAGQDEDDTTEIQDEEITE